MKLFISPGQMVSGKCQCLLVHQGSWYLSIVSQNCSQMIRSKQGRAKIYFEMFRRPAFVVCVRVDNTCTRTWTQTRTYIFYILHFFLSLFFLFQSELLSGNYPHLSVSASECQFNLESALAEEERKKERVSVCVRKCASVSECVCVCVQVCVQVCVSEWLCVSVSVKEREREKPLIEIMARMWQNESKVMFVPMR